MVCDVACSPSATIPWILSADQPRDEGEQQRDPAMTTREIKPRNAPLALRKIAMATMGKNSPTAPAAMMYAPNRPSSIWLSRRIGNSVPSAVVVRPIAIGTKAWTKPTAAKAPVTATATSAVTSQDVKRAGRPAPGTVRARVRSRQQEQEPEANVGYQLDASGSAHPKTCGPIRIPPR